MIIIDHRRNLPIELSNTPIKYGIEMDIRSWGNKLIVTHDPFTDGVDFKDWILNYNHRLLIVNVKEEGLESKIEEILFHYGIENYFFLDQSFPFLIKSANKGQKRCAIRVSEFESIETALTLANKVNWIWVDCFTKNPLNKEQYQILKNAGFKLCFVSPELQGRELNCEFIQEIFNLGIPDAVCTKKPDIWEKNYLNINNEK